MREVVRTITLGGVVTLGVVMMSSTRVEGIEVGDKENVKELEVKADILNIRTKEGVVIGRAKKGELLKMRGEEGSWVEVEYKGIRGYVSKQYVGVAIKNYKEVQKRGELKGGRGGYFRKIGVISEGDKVEVREEKEGWLRVVWEGKEGWIERDLIERGVKYGKEVRSGTTIRESRSIKSKKIGEVEKGDKVKVYEEYEGWSEIEKEGVRGYILSAFMEEKKIELSEGVVYKKAKGDVNIREEGSMSGKILGVLSRGEKVEVLNEESGWSKIRYKGIEGYVASSYLEGDVEGNPVEKPTEPEYKPTIGESYYDERGYSLEEHVEKQLERVKEGGNVISATKPRGESRSVQMERSRFVPAEREDIEYFLNPLNFKDKEEGKGQFLRIDKYREGITEEELNSYLNKLGKDNVFYNQGGVFIRSAKESNIDVSYLVAHAMWETGFGKSSLAKGVEVNEYKGEKLEKPVKVYNFFGIGAIDGSAVSSGAEASYKNGWTTVEKAIKEGAEWIGKNYIHSSKYKQNTLYEMKWNYDYTWHQYATDVNWCNGISKIMKDIRVYYGGTKLEYEIPKYK